jgi:hypothetical protein
MQTGTEPTCGKGLAENSVLPSQVGKLIAAMAENLEAHMKALDLTDENSAAEFAAYDKLIKELKQAALELHVTANQMAGYRDLPMGRHAERDMMHPRVGEAFERFLSEKQALLSLLQETTQRDAAILETMRAHT